MSGMGGYETFADQTSRHAKPDPIGLVGQLSNLKLDGQRGCHATGGEGSGMRQWAWLRPRCVPQANER